MKSNKVRRIVRERYASIARGSASCCTPVSSCCGGGGAESISRSLGYSETELSDAPRGANMGLGCGNPLAIEALNPGETVIDLGAGGGFDCFLAAKTVGETGKVIGVDMTPEMVEKARENAAKGNYDNVEFRLGEIENLPAADNTADAVISNCVINLSPDKAKTFREAFRVTKPGGKLMVSDIVLTRELPEAVKNSPQAYSACVSGAINKNDYLQLIGDAGFAEVKIVESAPFKVETIVIDAATKSLLDEMKITPEQLKSIEGTVLSIKVRAVKPL